MEAGLYFQKNINVEEYKALGVEISQSEVVETIREASLHKATDPMMVSNEMLKKLLTKEYEVITKGLNTCLNVLSPANNIALPNIFTTQPIQQINHIQEDAQLALQRIQVLEATIKLIINIFNAKTNRVIIMLGKTELYD
ncbi:15639_t:CDS:2, partial [Gigaspora margarita]